MRQVLRVGLLLLLACGASAQEGTPPQPRAAQSAPLARPGPVAEPPAFRGEPYKAPVPETLSGAFAIEDLAARALWLSGRVGFVDVMPVAVKPANLPEGTIWRDPPRNSIPGSIWLPNTGYDGLDPVTMDYLVAGLAKASDGDKTAPLVIFCMTDCWMSWNAGKRAVELGYTRIFWYRGGADAWEAAGWPLERATAFKP